jgi:soluble lytic murein transglycosylase-like protein
MTGKKTLKGLAIIAFLFVPSLVLGENPSVVPNPLVIDKAMLGKITLSVKQEKGNTLSETARIIAMEEGLSPKLVDSIIQAESNGDAKAVSRKGAMGLIQLMPGTAKDYQVPDPFDPVANIRGGARCLRDLLEEFAGNLSLALAAYNAGPAAVRKYQGIPPFPETQEFVRKVQGGYQKETSIPAYLVFASKSHEIAPSDKGSEKITISGSPREVAAFMKFLRKDKSEGKNR